MRESETRGFAKTKYDSAIELQNAKKQAFFAKPPLTGKPVCQKKLLENPVKSKYTIPKIKPNLTIVKIVTPPSSPKKVYPPLEPDEDILEIDLKFSDSEDSGCESKSPSSKIDAINTNEQRSVNETPRKRSYTSVGKRRLDPSVFDRIGRPATKSNFTRAAPKPFPKSVKRANPFAWSKFDPPSKRAPINQFARPHQEVAWAPATSAQPPTIIINNYYRGVPYPPPYKPPPQCTDPTRMSRGQFKRFTNRKSTTQEQINEALAIRNAWKKQ